MSTKGVVNIRGKEYQTVAYRVNKFRESCGITEGWSLNTHIHELNEHHAVMRAAVIDPEGRTVGTGSAIEFWGDGNINKSSALENAETSAIGRALASCGLGGEEYCTANELLTAVETQKGPDPWESGEEEVVYEPPVLAAEPVEDDVPDIQDLRDEAGVLAEKLFKKMGGPYTRWHINMLYNMCGVSRDNKNPALEDVTSHDGLIIFIDGQKDKLRTLEE